MTDNPDSGTTTSPLELTADLDDFYEAWHFLLDHPLFFYKGLFADANESGFEEALSMYVVKVDPELDEIHPDSTKNVMTQVWLECGPYLDANLQEAEIDNRWAKLGTPCHDPELDTGGATFEIAICALARRVLERHGSYVVYRICSHCLKNRPAGTTDPNAEWFCSPSCEQCGPVGMRFEPVDEGLSRYVSPSEYCDCEHWRGR